MWVNGSLGQVFETDGDHNCFMTVLAAHKEARVSEQVSRTLEFCKTERKKKKKKKEVLNHIKLYSTYTNCKRCILPLLQNGLLAFTIPDTPKSRSQKYKTTESGFAALKHHVGSCEEGDCKNETEVYCSNVPRIK